MTPFVQNYYVAAVRHNPRVFGFLLRDLTENDLRWDARPDPQRFTLREIIAHLVDFDSISRERFERIIREERPELTNWDEGEAAAHYAARHPLHQLESWLLSRRELGDWLHGLREKEWQRRGTRPLVGQYSVEQGVALMLAHDAYHLAQVIDWLGATANPDSFPGASTPQL